MTCDVFMCPSSFGAPLSQVEDHSLFLFLQIRTGEDSLIEQCSFNLGTLLAMKIGSEKDQQDSFVKDLLKVQTRALGEFFFERLKGNTSIAMAKAKLPPSLCQKCFDDELDWFLVSLTV